MINHYLYICHLIKRIILNFKSEREKNDNHIIFLICIYLSIPSYWNFLRLGIALKDGEKKITNYISILKVICLIKNNEFGLVQIIIYYLK